MLAMVRYVAVFFIGALLGSQGFAVISAQSSRNTVRVMQRDLGGWCDGKEVIVDISEQGPGPGARHYHHAHSFTLMLEGSRDVIADGEAPHTIKAGEIHYETPMMVNATNNTSPVKVVTFRIQEKGKPETVTVP